MVMGICGKDIDIVDFVIGQTGGKSNGLGGGGKVDRLFDPS